MLSRDRAMTPPTLIIHGDSDELVPLQQSELIMEKFKGASVPAELVVKKGGRTRLADDLWPDFKTIADWFDKYLKPRHHEPRRLSSPSDRIDLPTLKRRTPGRLHDPALF